jgi:hypothetical protein
VLAVCLLLVLIDSEFSVLVSVWRSRSSAWVRDTFQTGTAPPLTITIHDQRQSRTPLRSEYADVYDVQKHFTI